MIGKKVKDARITQLLHKMLKAGYLEDWKYNRTLSGTPQGGIISPLLANIYLHELDKFIADMKAGFDKPKDRVFTPEYMHVAGRVHYISRLLKKEVDPMRIQTLLQEQKVLRAQMLRLPAKSQTDKRINYVRYADDFLIGVIGSKEDCVEIKARIKAFLADKLKLELSDEKTLITHSAEYARFLGYVFADGHVCLNDERYVRAAANGLRLTAWANAHVDQCCLRFVSVYEPCGFSDYRFSCLNSDEEYNRHYIFWRLLL